MSADGGRQWLIFFRYTAWSVIGGLAIVPLVAAYAASVPLSTLARGFPLALAVLLAQVALIGWSSWRALRRWAASPAPARLGRWDIPLTGRITPDWTLALALAPTLAVAALTLGSAEGAVVTLMSLTLAATGAAWFIPHVGVLAAVPVFFLAAALTGDADLARICAAIVLALVLTIRLSLRLAAVVRELDRARGAQAQLAVAEERLRFARDLHDVAGRDLSTIAVTSELVATLVERGDARALERSREVAQIARSSLSELRGLVRGYREADLAAELRGTVALLRSAGAEVTTRGAAEDVPEGRADAAAWVLREGGTNILRHAEARHVAIELGGEGVRLSNDGAPDSGAHGSGAVEEGTGLQGLRERLGPDSGLETRREGGRFTLDVRFGAAPPGPGAGTGEPRG